MALLAQFAAFAAGLTPQRMPPDVLAKAKLCVIDAASASLTIGTTPGSAAALALVRPGGGEARVIGRRLRAEAGDAAFVNAASAGATIRTDTHPASASHPGLGVVPAVLAWGEAQGASGARALCGIVAGYEFMIRLGLAVVTPELAAVFRPTGLLAPGAAALGAATAGGLSQEATVRAVALGCHAAAGFNEWVAAGTNEHIYHAGFAARHAVAALRLAQAGAQAAPTLLEGKAGLLAGFGALDRAAVLTAGLGSRFHMLETVFKPAPACIFAQAPAQAAAALVQAHRPDPAAIERVEIVTTSRAVLFPGCAHPGPFPDLPGVQQSIPFSVAAVLLHGAVREPDWRIPADPRIAHVASLCRLSAGPEAGARQPVSLTVHMRGGVRHTAQVADFTSMTEAEVTGRFLASASPVLGDRGAARALDALLALERAPGLGAVTDLLTPPD